MAPPQDFSDLSTVYNASAGTFHNVIGVVVDLMAPDRTRTGEYMVTFKILDPKLRDAVYGSQGIRVRFFKKDEQHLPRVRSLGDVVLIRNIKASPFNQQPFLLANYQTTVVVFPGTSIPEPTFQVAFQGTKRLECLGVPLDKEEVTLSEQNYVIALKHDMKDTTDALPDTSITGFGTSDPGEPAPKRPRLSEPSFSHVPPPNAPAGPSANRTRQSDGLPQSISRRVRNSSFGTKFKLVKELAHYDFADICAEVVKKFPLPYGGCDLYVSDYTANKDMFYYAPPEQDQDQSRDGDVYGYAGGLPKRQFPGPYEFHILKVNVKDPHAHVVNHKINEGDFVLLQNVKMKARDGAKLEGDMWPDSRNPEKVQVSKLRDHGLQEIQDVLLRKEKYWEARKGKVQIAENAGLTKKEKKQKKKKEKKAEKKAAEAGAMDALLKEKSKVDVNKHVKCSHDEVPITSVKDILDTDDEKHTNAGPGGTNYVLPFINAIYRARVRVVDFEPQDLEDFAIPAHSDADSADDDSINGMDWQTSQTWIWSFRLLLEDASTPTAAKTKGDESNRIWASFHHLSAQYLLGNSMPDPTDLRSDTKLLAQLREKMCILWGNLEESRRVREEDDDEMDLDGVGERERVSNMPFECCIQEYGVEVDGDDDERKERAFGFERCFAATGVTIT